jgi:hypothetical protein
MDRFKAFIHRLRTWRLWFFVVLLIAGALAKANHDVFPSSFWLLTILLIVTVGVSQWLTSYREIQDPKIKRVRNVAEWSLSVALFLNLAYHAFVSRGMSSRTQLEAQREARSEEAEQRRQHAAEIRRKDAESQRLILDGVKSANESKAKADAAAANRAAHERGLIKTARESGVPLPRNVSKGLGAGPAPAVTLPPLQLAGSVEQEAALADIEIKNVETPAEFLERHSFWLFLFGLAEPFLAILGGAYFLTKLHEDKDGNGWPDWTDRMIESGQVTIEDLQARFGHRWGLKKALAKASAALPQRPMIGNLTNRPKFVSDGSDNAQSNDADKGVKNAPLPDPPENHPHADSDFGIRKTADFGHRKPSDFGIRKVSEKIIRKPSEKSAKKPSEKSTGRAERVGKNWRVLGVTLPDVKDARYEGKPRTGVVNVRPFPPPARGGSKYICNIGKRDLAELAAMPEADRFAKVRDKIEAAKVHKSEKEFGEDSD